MRERLRAGFELWGCPQRQPREFGLTNLHFYREWDSSGRKQALPPAARSGRWRNSILLQTDQTNPGILETQQNQDFK